VLLSLAVYGRTLCPTVGFIDSGELTTNAWTLGIAHPTGYPLYTLLSRLAVLAPVGSVALRINLLSALAASFASFVAYCAFLRLIGLVTEGGESAWAAPAALSGALCFAWSLTLWSQAVVAEVYALSAALGALLLWSLFAVLQGGARTARYALLLCYLVALSMGNHLSIITVALPVAVVFVLAWVRSAGQWRILLAGAVLGALALAIYLYLPLRSTREPLLNWGDPRTAERFLWHISAKQYRVWMFGSSAGAILRRLGEFVLLLFRQFHPLPLLVAIGGAWLIGREARKIGFFFLFVVVANLLYVLNYDIPDIAPYYLPIFLVAAAMIGVGAYAGVLRIIGLIGGIEAADRRARLHSLSPIISLVPLILPVIAFAANYHVSDMSGNYLAYDYAMNVLISGGPNGIIVTNNWDIYSPALYIRHVEGLHRDVAIIDKELLRRSWYLRSLAKEYPWLTEGASDEIDAYMEYLDQFEHGVLEDSEEIQARFINMINRMLTSDLDVHPSSTTFVNGHDLDALMLAPRARKIPHGIVYRIQLHDSLADFDYGRLSLRGAFDQEIYKDERTRHNLMRYPQLMFERAKVLGERGDYLGAIGLLGEALRWGEGEVQIRLNLGICLGAVGRYREALHQFNIVLRLDPGNELATANVRAIEQGLSGGDGR